MKNGISKIGKFYFIGNVKVSVTSQNRCIEAILSEKEDSVNYICVGNVRTAVLGNRNEEYRNVVNNAYMNLPDGMPLVWAGRLAGAKEIKRTSGPDLFTELLKEKYGLKHFLLGDTEDTLNTVVTKINSLNPQTIVAGHYSPPFVPIEELDFTEIAHKISCSGANIVWVALGAPKQDFVSAELIKHCEKVIIIGVGAAFRFFIGEYNHPPRIFQLLGLEGVFWRFFKNPGKELIWYAKHIPRYVWLLTKIRYDEDTTTTV